MLNHTKCKHTHLRISLVLSLVDLKKRNVILPVDLIARWMSQGALFQVSF